MKHGYFSVYLRRHLGKLSHRRISQSALLMFTKKAEIRGAAYEQHFTLTNVIKLKSKSLVHQVTKSVSVYTSRIQCKYIVHAFGTKETVHRLHAPSCIIQGLYEGDQ